MRSILLNALIQHGMTLPVVLFVLMGLLVYRSGSRLVHHADTLAGASVLGRLWIGMLLLAASTSLPELITDVYSSALRTPNLGIGDLVGSSLANMSIMATLDLVYVRRRIFDDISREHIMVGALAILLAAIAGAAIASHGWRAIGGIDASSIVIVLLYLIGMRAVRAEQPAAAPPEQLPLGTTRHVVLRKAIVGFSLSAAALALSAPVLVLAAEGISRTSGLGETFVGTVLVGLTTSLPEGVATFAAVRLGATDLAVANLFGSNAFNMCIFLPMDLASPTGSVLVHAAAQNVVGLLLAIAATALAVMRLLTPRGKTVGLWRPESLLILAAYGGAIWLLR